MRFQKDFILKKFDEVNTTIDNKDFDNLSDSDTINIKNKLQDILNILKGE